MLFMERLSTTCSKCIIIIVINIYSYCRLHVFHKSTGCVLELRTYTPSICHVIYMIIGIPTYFIIIIVIFIYIFAWQAHIFSHLYFINIGRWLRLLFAFRLVLWNGSREPVQLSSLLLAIFKVVVFNYINGFVCSSVTGVARLSFNQYGECVCY